LISIKIDAGEYGYKFAVASGNVIFAKPLSDATEWQENLSETRWSD
jgi:hypothetical protein